jgi:hypothetical protein
MIKSVSGWVFICICFFLNHNVQAQVPQNYTDDIYGYDPVLYNGKHYLYQSPPHASGSPMMFETGFVKGWLVLKNKTYHQVDLNCDLLNQLLIMRFVNHSGAVVVIEVPQSWLQSFGFDESEFVFRRPDDKNQVCQVIASGGARVEYQWYKELKLDNVMSSPVYNFSVAKKKKMLYLNGNANPYTNNRDFLKAFDASVRSKLRSYMKTNKIKVNKSSDKTIKSLLDYYNTII